MRRDESGSLIIALFGVMVITSIVLVTMTTVYTGQVQSQRTTKFEQALQASETGLNRMVALVRDNPGADPATNPFPAITGTDPASGGTYTVTAVHGTDEWVVQSSGSTTNGATRTIRANVSIGSIFNWAAYGQFLVDFNGGNGADSYNSASTTVANPSAVCDGTGSRASMEDGERMCSRTSKGIVATNGELKLKGQAADNTDRAEIHYAKEKVASPLADATGFCSGVPALCNKYNASLPNSYPAGTTPPAGLYYYREPVELPEIKQCDGYTPTGNFSGAGTLAAGTVYAFTNVTLSNSTTILGTPAAPTILCVSGIIDIPNAATVNGTTDGAYSIPKPPGGLVILSKFNSTSTPGIKIGNHAAVSAAIYAPNASFDGGAQGNIYGSIVASSIDNNGGWNFHYDEALASSTVNLPVVTSNWVEVR